MSVQQRRYRIDVRDEARDVARGREGADAHSSGIDGVRGQAEEALLFVKVYASTRSGIDIISHPDSLHGRRLE